MVIALGRCTRCTEMRKQTTSGALSLSVLFDDFTAPRTARYYCDQYGVLVLNIVVIIKITLYYVYQNIYFGNIHSS